VCSVKERRCNDNLLEECISKSPLAIDNSWEVISNCNDSCNPDITLCESFLELKHGGTVNVTFSYDMKTNSNFSCKVKEKPNWSEYGVLVEGNTVHIIVMGKPWHISNEEVGLEKIEMDCENDTELNHYIINLKINPGYFDGYLQKEYNEDKVLYDHIQPINLDGGTVEDVILLCETGYCGCDTATNHCYPDGRPNERMKGVLEEYAKGLKEELNNTIETTGLNILSSKDERLRDINGHDYSFLGVDLPIEFHKCQREDTEVSKRGDSTCNEIIDVNKTSTQGVSENNVICIYGTNHLFKEHYIVDSHEYMHTILSNSHLNSALEEYFTYPLSWAIVNELDSFSELRLRHLGDGEYGYAPYDEFVYRLNESFGFEINKEDNNDISGLFNLFRDDLLNGGEIYPDTIGDLKCKLDTVTGQNTYDIVENYICKDGTSPNVCRCFDSDGSPYPDCDGEGEKWYKYHYTDDPYKIKERYYVEPDYCGN